MSTFSCEVKRCLQTDARVRKKKCEAIHWHKQKRDKSLGIQRLKIRLECQQQVAGGSMPANGCMMKRSPVATGADDEKERGEERERFLYLLNPLSFL